MCGRSRGERRAVNSLSRHVELEDADQAWEAPTPDPNETWEVTL